MKNKKAKSVVIYENQRGILYKNGKLKGLLGAGKHCLLFGKEIEVCNLADEISLKKCSLAALLKDESAREQIATVEVGDEQIALHYVNGRFTSLLRQGTHAFFAVEDKQGDNIVKAAVMAIVDISTPEVDAKLVPEYVFSKMTQSHYTKVEVAENQRAKVYFNQKLAKTLTTGTHYFWKTPVRVDVVIEEI